MSFSKVFGLFVIFFCQIGFSQDYCGSSNCEIIKLDLNGDNKQDICSFQKKQYGLQSICSISEGNHRYSSGIIQNIFQNADYSSWTVVKADFDGDEKEDICAQSVSSIGWKIRCAKSLGNGHFEAMATRTLSTLNYNPSNINYEFFVMDLNSDSRNDFCLTSTANSFWKIRCASSLPNNTFSVSIEHQVDQGNYRDFWTFLATDSNNDDVDDFICGISQNAGGLHARCLKPRSDSFGGNYYFQLRPHRVLDSSGDYKQWQVVAMNIDNDDDEDICIINTGNSDWRSRCALFKDDGYISTIVSTNIHDLGDYRNWEIDVADINFDGRDDICVNYAANDGWYSRCAVGSKDKVGGFITKPSRNYQSQISSDWKFLMVDTDGFGQADLCLAQINNLGSQSLQCVSHRGPQNSFQACSSYETTLRSLGARGDGVSNDGGVLESIFRNPRNCNLNGENRTFMVDRTLKIGHSIKIKNATFKVIDDFGYDFRHTLKVLSIYQPSNNPYMSNNGVFQHQIMPRNDGYIVRDIVLEKTNQVGLTAILENIKIDRGKTFHHAQWGSVEHSAGINIEFANKVRINNVDVSGFGRGVGIRVRFSNDVMIRKSRVHDMKWTLHPGDPNEFSYPIVTQNWGGIFIRQYVGDEISGGQNSMLLKEQILGVSLLMNQEVAILDSKVENLRAIL